MICVCIYGGCQQCVPWLIRAVAKFHEPGSYGALDMCEQVPPHRRRTRLLDFTGEEGPHARRVGLPPKPDNLKPELL